MSPRLPTPWSLWSSTSAWSGFGCACECHAEAPWWNTPTEDCCFLVSAKWFLWVSPHLHGILSLSEFPFSVSSLSDLVDTKVLCHSAAWESHGWRC